jgi:hypothetical protein
MLRNLSILLRPSATTHSSKRRKFPGNLGWAQNLRFKALWPGQKRPGKQVLHAFSKFGGIHIIVQIQI